MVRFFTRSPYSAFLVFLLLILSAKTLPGQCTLVCNSQLNIGLPASCSATINYDLILANPDACSPGGPANFSVTVLNPQGTLPISTSPNVTTAYLGQVLPVLVQHIPSGNTCTGYILVQDNLGPSILCPPDITVSCTQSIDLPQTGYVLANDCSNYFINQFDVTTDLGCNDPHTLYTRTFVAADIFGNTNSCQQLIYVALPNVGEVAFPPNRDNIQGPALDCANPNTSPAHTGEPTIDGMPIISGTDCSLSAIYSDNEVPYCEASYTILRTWTVVEWCTGNLEQHTQVIKVEDNLGPNLNCSSNLSVSTTSSTACTADINLPAIGFTDNCSTQIDVSIQTPFGIVSGNGGLLPDVPTGTHALTYVATDACGNSSTCNVQLTVFDGSAPTVICDALASVTLGPAGTAIVPATIFDDGSFDNCCLEGFSIRRPDQGCNTTDLFQPTILFCCADVDGTVQVEVKVTDCAGNFNLCSASVIVKDQLTPTIVCPDDVTLECSANVNDLNLTGEPYVFDGCGIDTTSYADTYDLNDCQVGQVARIWTTTDFQGNTGTCNQLIFLEDTSPVSVVFPPDYSTTGCAILEDLDPEDLPPPFNAPQVNGDNCELMATNYTDLVFTVAPPACLKIIRTWTLIDWCTYEPNSGSTNGIWTGIQVIQVFDNEAPSLTCPPDQTAVVNSDNCLASVSLPNAVIDDCSENVQQSINSDFGPGNGPFPGIGIGVYEAVYTATDGCGNFANCSISITVIDTKKPTPYCINGLIVELDPIDIDGDMIPDDGTVVVSAEQFDAGSFDNCAGALTFSFSSDPTDTSRIFGCANIGSNPISLWVTDAGGNQDFCQTIFFVQDNQFACNSGIAPSIAGLVRTEGGLPVEHVNMALSGSSQLPFITGTDGAYEFIDLEMGGDYSVSPHKSGDWRNGVSTLDLVYIKRHILGIELLPSPYKIIASDADHSNTVTTLDILHFQKLIMHLTDSLPNNTTSWRFVDAAYAFQNPLAPLDELFPELLNLNNLLENRDDAHFTAIKLGDINNTATPEFGGSGLEVRAEKEVALVGQLPQHTTSAALRIPFRTRQAETLLALQVSIDYKATGLTLVDIQPNLLESSNFIYGKPEEGIVTLSWIGSNPLLSNGYESLFEMEFLAEATGWDLSQLRISTKTASSEAYNAAFEKLGIVLELERDEAKSHPGVTAIYPNPFRTEAFWQLPDNVGGEEVLLEAFDQAGHRVWYSQVQLEPGHRVRVSREEFPGPGVYFLRIQGQVQKLLLID